MANPNDATFHARITADARDFIAQTLAASQALSALVAQSSKAGGASGAANAGKSGESEAKRLGAAMRAEQEKTSSAVKQNIQEENQLRADGLRGVSAQQSKFLTQPKPLTTMPGPIRAGGQGLRDEQQLARQFKLATGAVDGYTRGLTEAEKISRKLADINVTPAKNISRLEGPARNMADNTKLLNGMKSLRAEREMEIIHYKALIANRKYDASQQAAIARENRKQMDAMVTGRYALYDLAEAYDVVGRAGMRFLGLFKQAIQTAAEFETAFTSVEGALKPLPEEVDAIKQSLIELTRIIPVSFTQISEIATLGAQMGIAAADIDEFTKTVASFSAITGASVSETAESFGRIASLADVPVSEFQNLASAITFAGVNAVATEEQILTLTQSIAASSRQAGFSADEIVGLATALASLGIQPEQARGVLLRVFGEIGKEIDMAGEKLQVYSRISGMSADEIKGSWGKDPKLFFGAFLQGLSEVENKTAAFEAAGFVDTRETNVLQRLIGSLDVYNGSMQDAMNAYGDATYLGDRYALTVDNIASKITILQNNLAAFGDAIGSALEGPLKGVIDTLSFALIAITNFAKTPIGGFIVGFVGVATALVTVLSLVAAASFRATAQLFAMRTAMIQMSRAGSSATGGLKELIQTMLGNVRMLTLASGETVFYTRKQALANGVLSQWTAAANTATIATRGLTLALRVLGIASGVLTGLTLVGIAAEMMGIVTEAKKIEGVDFSSLSDSIKKDTEEFRKSGTAYKTFNVNVDKAAGALEKVSLAHEGVELATNAATDAVVDSTIAFGENTKAALINAIANDETIKSTIESFKAGGKDITKILEENGGSWAELVQASLADPGKGAIQYLKSIIPEAADALNYGIGIDAFQEIYGIQNELYKIAMRIDESSGSLQASTNYAELWGVGVTDATGKIGTGTDEAAQDVSDLVKNITIGFDAINKEIQVQEAIVALGKALKEGGNDFTAYSEAGRTNINALQGVITAYAEQSVNDPQTLANNLATLMQALTSMGINSAVALGMVKTALTETGVVAEDVVADALALLTGGLTNIPSAAGAAQSALERLQGAVEKTFAKMDRRIAFQDSLSSLRDSLLENGSNFSRFSESGRKNIGAVRDIIKSLAEASNGNSKVFSSSLNSMKTAMIDAGLGGTQAMAIINKAIKASGSNAKASASQVRQFASALALIDSGNVIAAADAISSLSDSVMGYLNAKWMLGNTQMEIASGWEDIANSASDARKEIEDVSAEIASLAADRSILEYQLGIALKYGDTLRANQLRAEIADLTNKQAELVQTSPKADLLSEQQALQSMVGYYVQMGAAEVIGAKNKEAARLAVEKTVLAFSQQAIAAGVSEANVTKYAGELTKALTLATEVNKPTKFKISSETKEALNQVKTFTSEATSLINSIPREVVITTSMVGDIGVSKKSLVPPKKKKAMGGLITGAGSATSDSIPAMLSNGEFVVRSSAVKTYGLDFMNSLNRMQVSRSMPIGNPVTSASSSSIVHLSPEDRQLLRTAIDRPVNLYTDNAKIAQSANQGNVLLAQRGIK